MTGGWSNYGSHANHTSHKIHFYEKNSGKSVCGGVVLSDRKAKAKFIDPDEFNPKRICKKCIVKHKFLMVTKWGLQ